MAFLGFDSRMSVRAVARVPVNRRMTAFEVYGGKLFLGLGSEFVAVGSGNEEPEPPVSISSGAPIRNLMVDSSGGIWIDNGAGVRSLGPTGPRRSVLLTELAKQAWVTNSGGSSFLAVGQKNGVTRFSAISLTGERQAITSIPGRPSAVSWNGMGLAAVVGPNLVIWEAGSDKLVRLLTDEALLEAEDVCLIPNRRAVVSLKNLTVVVSGESRVVVAGFRSRPRYADGRLFLADAESNVVWEVGLPATLGMRDADAAHAKALLAGVDAATVPKNPAFLEAARILGCGAATAAVGHR